MLRGRKGRTQRDLAAAMQHAACTGKGTWALLAEGLQPELQGPRDNTSVHDFEHEVGSASTTLARCKVTYKAESPLGSLMCASGAHSRTGTDTWSGSRTLAMGHTHLQWVSGMQAGPPRAHRVKPSDGEQAHDGVVGGGEEERGHVVVLCGLAPEAHAVLPHTPHLLVLPPAAATGHGIFFF